MKKIALVTSLFLVVFSCNPKEEKQKQVEETDQTQTETQIQAQTEECFPRRYELCDKEYNYFDTSLGEIRLRIPVTDINLKYESTIKDISRGNLNAVLIHLTGGYDCTPIQPVRNFIEINESIAPLGLDTSRMNQDNSLLVVIFNDSEPLSVQDENRFAGIIERSSSYQEALREINGYLCMAVFEGNNPKKPKEQGGDVIGGNG